MHNLFKNEHGTYTMHDLKRANGRIIYWVVLPQGTHRKNKWGDLYSNTIQARTFRKAIQIANRYNAPIVERLIQSDLGRWSLRVWILHGLKSEDEAWDRWKGMPRIELNKDARNW